MRADEQQTGTNRRPLVSASVAARFTGASEPDAPLVHVRIFTDPLSAWCWAAEPVWLHLAESVGALISVEFKMMGLLRSLDSGDEEANRAAQFAMQWEEAAHLSGMPCNADRWFEQPISSSWPACAAFKAAEAICPSKAARFLRRTREGALCLGEDISRAAVIEEIATRVGLDVRRMLDLLESGEAGTAFTEDVGLAAESGATSPPSAFFFGPAGLTELRGPRPFEVILAAAEKVLGEAVPLCADPSLITDRHGYIKELIACRGSVTAAEAAELLSLDRTVAADLLDRMSAGGSLRRLAAGSGFLYLPV